VAAANGSWSSTQEVIRSRVDMIEIDVVVTDRRGEVVRGLTAKDFEIFEDGRPVAVAAFHAVDVPEISPSGATEPLASSGASHGNNAEGRDGRVFVIVLGNFELQVFPRVKRAVLALVDRLDPSDQVAMLSVGGRSTHQVEFTTEKQRIVRALDTPLRSAAQDHVILDVLRRVSDELEPIRGRRKVIVLVGDAGAGIARSADIGTLNLGPALQDFQASAARASVVLYAINPRYAFALDEMVVAESAEDRTRQMSAVRDVETGLQTIAATAGGWALVRSNLFEDGVNRLLAESRSYYVIGYTSPAPHDGKFHRISVSVRRPDVVVRARTGYMAPKPSTTGIAPTAALDRLIAAPLQSPGLNLRMVATPVPSRSRAGSAVLLVTEVDGNDVSGAPGLEVKAVALDMRGRIRATDNVEVALPPHAAGGDRWIRFASSLQLGPGRWQLRIAARRADGRAEGSVFVEIEVPDFTRDLVLGGLVIATPGRAGVVGANRIPPELPSVPVAALELPAGMAVRAVLPLRVGARQRSASVRVRTNLVRADGRTRELEAVERPAREFSEGGVVEVPIPYDLEPGPYRLQMHVWVGRATGSREVSFSIR
jgi:VWFA-related protein